MMAGAGFRPYGAYRDSGVDWIGTIPSTWDVQRAKWLFKRMDRAVRPDDDIVTCFRDGEVTLRNNRRTEGFTTALKEIGYQGIRKGDLVIHAMDAFAGAIGVSDSDGKATPVYSACVPRQPNNVDPTFYAYYMRHLALSGFLVSLAKGIRERSTDFRFNDFAELEVPFPSLVEQRAIVSFLDEKCTKIDGAVKIKEDQIELLRERRQIIIQEAVTHGLNPAVPLKDSGIDWIGQIPAHWEILPLLTVANVKSVSNRPDLELLSVYLDRGVVPFADVEEKRTNATSLDLSAYQVVEVGDLVLNNQQAWRGSVGVSEFRGIVSPAYIVLSLSGAFDSKFANFYFRAGSTVAHYLINSKGVGTIQRNLYWPKLKRSLVTIPPKSEQFEIVSFIQENTDRIDEGIAIKERQIAALKEYKTSLINAAVTGKIKVI
jgi:type I restriction enzyme S subunit